eukprot:1711557-Ditylum_brightwellii.AAC.1
MHKFDIKDICKKTPRKLMWEKFEYTRKNPLRNGTVVYNCTYQSQRKEMEQCKAKCIGSPEDEGIK